MKGKEELECGNGSKRTEVVHFRYMQIYVH